MEILKNIINNDWSHIYMNETVNNPIYKYLLYKLFVWLFNLSSLSLWLSFEVPWVHRTEKSKSKEFQIEGGSKCKETGQKHNPREGFNARITSDQTELKGLSYLPRCLEDMHTVTSGIQLVNDGWVKGQRQRPSNIMSMHNINV